MGILDDAIREHLELKRQHGAAEDELQELEDDAFGSSERPGAPAADDSYEEAPTEFMAQPEVAAQEVTAPAGEEEDSPAEEREAESPSGSEPAPPAGVEEEHHAMEHELPPPAPVAEEGEQSSADQPTEMYDVESEFAASEESAEPEEGEEDEDDLFDEKSLSDELDQALDAPAEQEGEYEAEDEEAEYEEEPAPESDDSGERQDEEEGGEGESEEEDVLEETPEFLEDAPESERLWFEQKPPKDFDFDD